MAYQSVCILCLLSNPGLCILSESLLDRGLTLQRPRKKHLVRTSYRSTPSSTYEVESAVLDTSAARSRSCRGCAAEAELLGFLVEQGRSGYRLWRFQLRYWKINSPRDGALIVML